MIKVYAKPAVVQIQYVSMTSVCTLQGWEANVDETHVATAESRLVKCEQACRSWRFCSDTIQGLE